MQEEEGAAGVRTAREGRSSAAAPQRREQALWRQRARGEGRQRLSRARRRSPGPHRPGRGRRRAGGRGTSPRAGSSPRRPGTASASRSFCISGTARLYRTCSTSGHSGTSIVPRRSAPRHTWGRRSSWSEVDLETHPTVRDTARFAVGLASGARATICAKTEGTRRRPIGPPLAASYLSRPCKNCPIPPLAPARGSDPETDADRHPPRLLVHHRQAR